MLRSKADQYHSTKHKQSVEKSLKQQNPLNKILKETKPIIPISLLANKKAPPTTTIKSLSIRINIANERNKKLIEPGIFIQELQRIFRCRSDTGELVGTIDTKKVLVH